MGKIIEDEIHDIIIRNLNETLMDCITGGKPVEERKPFSVKDLEACIESLPYIPDYKLFFMTPEGKSIAVDKVVGFGEITEDRLTNVMRNHPDLGIDLTHATLISVDLNKLAKFNAKSS